MGDRRNSSDSHLDHDRGNRVSGLYRLSCGPHINRIAVSATGGASPRCGDSLEASTRRDHATNGEGVAVTSDSSEPWRNCSLTVGGHSITIPTLPSNSPVEFAA